VNFWTDRQIYRLVDKYMRQPRLMKLNITNIDENCLSSDVVFITFTYFLNPPYPSLKYSIQFFPIDTPQNRLQWFKNCPSSPTWVRSSFSFTVGNK
jgi:hypothetical protein